SRGLESAGLVDGALHCRTAEYFAGHRSAHELAGPRAAAARRDRSAGSLPRHRRSHVLHRVASRRQLRWGHFAVRRRSPTPHQPFMKPRGPVRRRVLLLAVLYAAVLFAGFLAPYAPNEQNRDAPFASPTRLRFVDETGTFHLRPFVYALASRPGHFNEYDEDRSRRYPLKFLTTGPRYTIAGIPAERRLFGVSEPARLFLFGTDQFGRDVFSRMCIGAQVSLVGGVLAAGLALVLAVAVGGLAGFYGGWTDEASMRVAEIFMALPWLYLLLAVRSVLPLHIVPARAFLLLILVIGLVGWARPARLVRGLVLSA